MSQQVDLDRRRFFTGKILSSPRVRKDYFNRSSLSRTRSDTVLPVRPPWSVQEQLFTDLCTRCSDCIDVCETGLLVQGSGGFPEADFKRAGCSFCQACEETCSSGAIRKLNDTPWKLEPVISEQCLALNRVHCRTCSEMCEPSAIEFQLKPGGVAQPSIDSDPCTACGECVSSCPVDAITMTGN
ncbi:ferredoxin-type protein NapF [Endozoicomonas arenosclerae]|uniref:ferredoxin-type protein NapF n=1 Tax=Endozoicomonas arenosclerae TaxID=1633495 RepID=UPI000783D8F4|nr:ferredoxin-type protein NapF [Endozoicomonas arenosclerae]